MGLNDSTRPDPGDTQQRLLFKIAQILNLPGFGGSSIAGAPVEMDRGVNSISNGGSTVSVVFNRTFGSIPSVVASISRNAGDPLVLVNVNRDSVTTVGFTAELSGPVPNGNYKIDWRAER